MRKPKTTNPQLLQLIQFLRHQSKKNDAKIWKDIAERLAKPRRKRITVNISRLNRHTNKKETVLVPGKVLGAGRINHPINVAAFSFSKRAEEKIRTTKGKTLSILELAKKNPNGSNVKIIG
jgi:large subunit ribosomal protein L18e